METESTQNTIEITNPEKLQEAVEAIKKDGADRLHILTDFDRTLTTAKVDGKSMPSLISILRDGNYLTPDYAAKAHSLYNHYAPIEKDLSLPKAERKKAMEEWWRTHFELLVKSGLTKSEVNRAIDSGKIKFRDGVFQFLEILHKNNVPVVIMSSSALGGEAITRYLQKAKHHFDNISVISNSFIWDEQDNAVGVREPIIHGMGKDETMIQNFPVFNQVEKRPNVILLGDSEGDVGMVEGFDYKNLIKIGFLNEDVNRHLEHFKKLYDITITNDGTFEYINKLINKIF